MRKPYRETVRDTFVEVVVSPTVSEILPVLYEPIFLYHTPVPAKIWGVFFGVV